MPAGCSFGPVIAVLANHAFQTLAGATLLSDPDRERLFSGTLYLRITMRKDVVRVPLKPPAKGSAEVR